jgi:hypothetical protein
MPGAVNTETRDSGILGAIVVRRGGTLAFSDLETKGVDSE